jgi:hypothetical protein
VVIAYMDRCRWDGAAFCWLVFRLVWVGTRWHVRLSGLARAC